MVNEAIVLLTLERWARLLTCGIGMEGRKSKVTNRRGEQRVVIRDMGIIILIVVIIIANIYQVLTLRHFSESSTCINPFSQQLSKFKCHIITLNLQIRDLRVTKSSEFPKVKLVVTKPRFELRKSERHRIVYNRAWRSNKS